MVKVKGGWDQRHRALSWNTGVAWHILRSVMGQGGKKCGTIIHLLVCRNESGVFYLGLTDRQTE